MKLQLKKLIATVALLLQQLAGTVYDEAAAAETHCNGCIATAAISCNICNIAETASTLASQLQQ